MKEKQKISIVTGVTGQMGSYFAEFLLSLGHQVIGTERRLSVKNRQNIQHILNNPDFIIEPMDLGDAQSINNLVEKWKPDYFVNCAANSFVGSSWDYPEQHFEYNTLGVLRQLEAIKRFSPHTKYINMGSSEEMGDVQYSPQDTRHPARARSFYAASKIAARQVVKVYRESFGLYALQCWCFNYESERRGIEFLPKKISFNLGKIFRAIRNKEKIEPIVLGCLESRRDWMYALDTVDGVWRMLNQEEYNPELAEKLKSQTFNSEEERRKWLSRNVKEYIFATGVMHSVRDFINTAFAAANIPIVDVNPQRWEPSNDLNGHQINYTLTDGTPVVTVSRKFYRPADVFELCGDSTPARTELGWEPKVNFKQLVSKMVEHDIRNFNG